MIKHLFFPALLILLVACGKDKAEQPSPGTSNTPPTTDTTAAQPTGAGAEGLRFQVFDSAAYQVQHCPGVFNFWVGPAIGKAGEDSLIFTDSTKTWVVYGVDTFQYQADVRGLDSPVFLSLSAPLFPHPDTVTFIQIRNDTVSLFTPTEFYSSTCAGHVGFRHRGLKIP